MKFLIKNRAGEQGFSLIELMIVIAIIGILIGVGIPAWRNAVIAANETSAIQSLRTIAAEQRTYYIRTKEYGTFDQLIQAGALDQRYAGESPVVDGYIFTMKVTPKATNQPPGFAANADPQVSEGLTATGKRHFYMGTDTNGVTANATQPATAKDPPAGA